MIKDSGSYLLPAGFGDGLPPEAEREAEIVEKLMACFAGWGYRRVKPPLMEFEDSLLAGPGAAMSAHTFRLMDPVSQRMMGLRADMTPQVGRIAASRLAGSPRPLRLSYAGQVLRVKGEQMLPERQLGQVGAELIGEAGLPADVEILLLAVDALRAIGIADLVVDLNWPSLAGSMLAEMEDRLGPLPPDRRAAILAALDRKDAAALADLTAGKGELLEALMRVGGAAETALPRLSALALPPIAAHQRDQLREIIALIRAAAPDLRLNIDVTDHRGFEYHTGLTFSLIGGSHPVEFGRGGRYVNHAGEEATGLSLYLGALVAVAPAKAAAHRVYLPPPAPMAVAAELRRLGWVTLRGLGPVADNMAEARRLGCDHLWTATGLLAIA